MVLRTELSLNRRIVLEGPSYVGKTYAAVNIVDYYTRHGKRVLYAGIEETSADQELGKLTDEQLQLVTLINYDNQQGREHTDLVTELKLACHKPPMKQYDLVVIDPIHHIQAFCRTFIRNEILKIGYCLMSTPDGQSIRKLLDKDRNSFEISGYEYGRANTAQDRLTKLIFSGYFPVVVTMTEDIVKFPAEIYALADFVVRFSPKELATRHYTVLKDRGGDIDFVTKPFTKGFDFMNVIHEYGILPKFGNEQGGKLNGSNNNRHEGAVQKPSSNVLHEARNPAPSQNVARR